MKLCSKCNKQFSDDANFCPVDAARLSPIEPQAATDSLATRFELGAQIGGGRTGAVHRATDKTTGKAVVVKLVSPAVMALAGVAQRLERELRQLERVQSAGVAKVIGSGKRGETTWLAMELLDGAHTLADAIGTRGPIPADRAADLIEVVGEALIEAAQVGVVHRDLAPKNVLFAGQDVKLINFSLAVPTSDKVPGVAEFVAPEQVDNRPVDQRSNLYSLGALYYFVLTGQPVFSGTPDEIHAQHKSGTIRPPSQVAPNAIASGSAIEGVIMRALDRSPTKRFLTVRQFVDEVGRVGRGEVIELKQAPAGRAGRPKGELVQTLMGVARGGEASKPTIASAPTVGSGVPSVAPSPAMPVAPVMPAPAPAAVAPAPIAATPRAASQPAVMQTVIGVATGAPPNQASPALPMPQMIAAQPAPSPWAPPNAGQPVSAQVQPALQAPMVAPSRAAVAPQSPQSPMMPQSPVVAAPVVAAAASGRKKADEGGGSKGKFRETMWFKKGDLDTQAAIAAADERARTGKEAGTEKADSMPIDERYKDDGSITRGDKEKYSLRTGATQMMQALRPDGSLDGTQKVSEDALIGEMKGGRGKIILAVGAAIVVIILIIVLAAR